jgi:hypothetical protein
MRKFVSLQAAMLMGVVLSKKQTAVTSIENGKHIFNEDKIAEIAKTIRLDKPVHIPQIHEHPK